MIRRRLLGSGMEDNEMAKEWKILLDQTVTDNSIFYYTVDAQGCKEFYVSIFFANDEEITSTINGAIALNASASPWSTGVKASGNIAGLSYSSAGNNNKAAVMGFEVANGIIIPTRLLQSFNTGSSSAYLTSSVAASVSLELNKYNNNELCYKTIDEVQNISVGSYTKFFGVGSKILILGR